MGCSARGRFSASRRRGGQTITDKIPISGCRIWRICANVKWQCQAKSKILRKLIRIWRHLKKKKKESSIQNYHQWLWVMKYQPILCVPFWTFFWPPTFSAAFMHSTRKDQSVLCTENTMLFRVLKK